MVSCHKSTEYVIGKNIDGLPHYFVKLTKKRLSHFDVQNSMVLLNSYDNLLLFLESQLYESTIVNSTDSEGDTLTKSQGLPIPPFDVIMVLFTLVSISSHYLEPQLNQNNPYNITKIDLNKRATKILNMFIHILKDFNTDLYSQYDLELLRCQFFLALDLLTCRSRVLSHNRFIFHLNQDNNSSAMEEFLKNPYKSYVSFLDKKGKVFNNPLIYLIFNKRDKFLNFFLWSLANSLSSDVVLYTDAREIWIPLMNILLDLYDLRQKYFLKNEVIKMRKQLFVQQLMQSPLSQFFSFVNRIENFSLTLIEYIFVNCETTNNTNIDRDWVKPIFYKENEFVKGYVNRFKYNKQFQLQEAMKLRKKILSHCFQLLLALPPNHVMPLMKMKPEEILSHIAVFLQKFTDLDQFKAFFQIYDLQMELAFMPLVIEKTINKLTADLCPEPFDLVNRIISFTGFIDEWINVVEMYLMVSIGLVVENSQYISLRKVEICLYFLFEYFELIIHEDSIKKSSYMNKIINILTEYQTKVYFLKRKFTNDNLKEPTGFDLIIEKYV
ncbi:Smc5-Smc6 complex subunit NSE5 PWA37_004027 [Arxiozyma heterogenica]|uniref:Uncharacterized protein n=1 Tax=Arxiozyma heterogenica TaxID=278026 RepID=A0AAN7WMV3_9SACH|nr:hypothetical protein RI543_003058 [Kazachstania heterogenica]